MLLRFVWSSEKAQRNFKKHKVAFEEAKTIFGDPWMLSIPDEAHSDMEERLLGIGESVQARLLLVVYTEQETKDGLLIRVISSRLATARERDRYESAER